MKKILTAAILCFALVFGNVLYPMNTAAAFDQGDGGIVTPMFTYVNQFSNVFNIDPDGRAELDSYLSFRNAEKATINMYLDRYENGTWIYQQSWSATSYDLFTSCSGARYVPHGYQYRMRAYGYVYSGGRIVETVSYESAPWYY